MVTDLAGLSNGTVLEQKRMESHAESFPSTSDKTEPSSSRKKADVIELYPNRNKRTAKDWEIGTADEESELNSKFSDASITSALKPENLFDKEIAVKTQPNEQFLEIMRTHFIEPIIDSFEKVQMHANTANAALFINQVFHSIRDMEDESPYDPFLDILFAIYDALAIDNNWINYSAEQYNKIKEILRKYSSRTSLNQKAIEKAIVELEEAGLDTTPFTIEIGGND